MTTVGRVTSLDRAERLVLGWARVYTRGLSATSADRRLGELESDCWEQRRWGDEVGASPVVVAISMMARTLAGIPADLLWRRTAHATARDRSRITRGETMRMLKTYWWLALAAIAGLLEVALGVSIGLEERNVGGAVGAVVIAGLGLVSIAGIGVRRRRVVAGDLMIAGGMLPLAPFLWTIVLPVLGLTVILAALVDAANHASVSSSTAAERPGTGDRALPAMVGTVVAAVVAGVVIGDGPTALLLVTPPATLLVSHASLRSGARGAPLARLGLVLIAASTFSTVIILVGASVLFDVTDAPVVIGAVVQTLIIAAFVVGVAFVVVGLRRRRNRARPA